MRPADTATEAAQGQGIRPVTPQAAEHVRRLFDLTGERWTVPVLATLRDGDNVRFGAVQRALPGLSQKQLTHTLRHLERDGYLLRTAYATIPPRVEYSLTELGHQLVTRLFLVGKFALDHRQKIETARQRYDAATAERDAMSQAS